jgi:hypothetical protein
MLIKSIELSEYEKKVIAKRATEIELEMLEQREDITSGIDTILELLSSAIIIKKIEHLNKVSFPKDISLNLADCSKVMLKSIDRALKKEEKEKNQDLMNESKKLKKFLDSNRMSSPEEVANLKRNNGEIKSEIKKINSEIKSSKKSIEELRSKKSKFKKKNKELKVEEIDGKIKESEDKIESLKVQKRDLSSQVEANKIEIAEQVVKNQQFKKITDQIDINQNELEKTQLIRLKITEMFSDWQNHKKIAGDIQVKSAKSSFKVSELTGAEIEKLRGVKPERVSHLDGYYVELPDESHVWIFDITKEQKVLLETELNNFLVQSKKSLSSTESVGLQERIKRIRDIKGKIEAAKEGRLIEQKFDVSSPEALEKIIIRTKMPEIDAAIDLGTLQGMEVTKENNQQFVDKLKYVASELFRKGNLEHIINGMAGYELDLAAPYAKKYLEVRDLIIGFRNLSEIQKQEMLNHLILLEGSVKVKDLRDVSHREAPLHIQDSKDLIPGINKQEMRNLRLVSLCLEKIKNKEKVNLTRAQKQELATFLQDAKGNDQLNKIISKSILLQRVPDGISLKALEFIRTFTFKSKYLDQFQPITSKMETSWSKVVQGIELAPNERLTVAELGVVNQLIKHSRGLSKLKEMGLTSKEAGFGRELAIQIESLRGLENTVRRINKEIQIVLEKEKCYKPGDIIHEKIAGRLMHNEGLKNPLTLLKKYPIVFQQRYLITPYAHEAIILPSDEFSGKISISEVIALWEYNELSFAKLTYSDVYRINPIKLLSKESASYLQQIDNDKFEDETNNIFQQIENDLHTSRKYNKKFQKIANDKPRQWNAGKTKFLFWQNFRKEQRDFTKLYEKFAGEDDFTGKKMICSEFASKTNIVALLELDKRLRAKIVKHLEETNQTELANKYRSGELKVIDLPISSHAKLKNLYPGRFVQLLAKRNAVEKVETPQVLQRLMK